MTPVSWPTVGEVGDMVVDCRSLLEFKLETDGASYREVDGGIWNAGGAGGGVEASR